MLPLLHRCIVRFIRMSEAATNKCCSPSNVAAEWCDLCADTIFLWEPESNPGL